MSATATQAPAKAPQFTERATTFLSPEDHAVLSAVCAGKGLSVASYVRGLVMVDLRALPEYDELVAAVGMTPAE